MHRLLFRAYNIDGAMNVAWRGTRYPERGSTGVETSSRMGVVTGDAAGRMRCHGNSIIDLRRGWTMGPSKTSSVSRRSRHPRPDISSSISDHDRFSFGVILFFAVLLTALFYINLKIKMSFFKYKILYYDDMHLNQRVTFFGIIM